MVVLQAAAVALLAREGERRADGGVGRAVGAVDDLVERRNVAIHHTTDADQAVLQRVLPRAAVKLLSVDAACGVQVAVGGRLSKPNFVLLGG
ncbi:MAG: hypothetical protein SF123_16095 [Chloroflexota bacterium]|nr:hypothetical protein [Chloroflexota bacterium]